MLYGAFRTQLSDVEKFFDSCDLSTRRLGYPLYKAIEIAAIKDKPYKTQFDYYLNNGFFDFELFDGSLVQFQWFEVEDNGKNRHVNLRYRYLDNPYKSLLTFERWLKEQGPIDGFSEDDLRMFFEDELKTAPGIELVTPVRYDYAPQGYDPGHHPASHLHFGHNNDVRIAADNVLQPLTFGLFICRQFYPRIWSEFHDHKNVDKWCGAVRKNLAPLEARYRHAFDERELRLY